MAGRPIHSPEDLPRRKGAGTSRSPVEARSGGVAGAPGLSSHNLQTGFPRAWCWSGDADTPTAT